MRKVAFPRVSSVMWLSSDAPSVSCARERWAGYQRVQAAASCSVALAIIGGRCQGDARPRL